MDSGNIAETQDETIQPGEVVVTDSEITEGTPQSEAIEENESYVDVEGDQQEKPNNMSDAQTRAAWKEEKRKRKSKADELKAQERLNKELIDEMQELKSQVARQSRGEEPDALNYESNADFYKAYNEWQGKGDAKPKPKATDNSQPNAIELSEDQAEHLLNSEYEIEKHFKDYDEAKESVKSKLNEAFGLPDDSQIIEHVAQFAHTYDADPAKVFYALNKLPNKIDDLVKASNPAQIGRILRDLDSKVKTRSKKAIGSKPEPKINGGGEVNNLNAQIEKAKDKWMESRTILDYKAYQAAKQKLKSK